jgi:CubicO group peptidase (beta-lactamase class C family)
MIPCEYGSRLCAAVWCCWFALSGSAGLAQTLEPATSDAARLLTKELQSQRDAHRLPAMWGGWYHADGRRVVAASGIRKWGATPEVTFADPIHLGSCTKAMTAVLIGQLCSEGKLRLDTTLRELFVAKHPSLADSNWGNVTVEQLLQHRSGAPANLNWHALDAAMPNDVVAARGSIIDELIGSKRAEASEFLYSNVGYALLGHVVETIDGRSWEEAIDARMFKRLEQRSAGFGPVGLPDGRSPTAEVLVDRPWGHVEASGIAQLTTSLLGGEPKTEWTPQQIDNARSLGPAGRVHMTIDDWSKFVITFGKPDGHALLGIDAPTWQRLRSPADPQAAPETQYAGGWIVVEEKSFGGAGLFHNGSNTTWYCYAFVMPQKQACVLVATNAFSDGASEACDDVARWLVKAASEGTFD